MRLPDFLGIGAMKAGTTTLHALLATHPDVALPRHRKEVMFFDRHHGRGVDWYAEHFAHAGPRRTGEITPGYLHHPEAAARIADLLPDARLFAILRDPVERAHSQFRFFVKEHAYAGSFEDFLAEHPNALSRGRYAEQLDRFRDRFPDAQLHVLLLEDLRDQPEPTVGAWLAFLGLDPDRLPSTRPPRANESVRPRFHAAYAVGRRALGWLYDHDLAWVVDGLKRTGVKRVFLGGRRRDDAPFPPMTDATRARLAELYAPDAERLGAWLGRDLAVPWTSLGDPAR